MVVVAMAAALAGGCAVSKRTITKPAAPPVQLLTATRQNLVTQYDHQARSITAVNATVDMILTTGSAYSGVIERYHEISGFILAQRPAYIRVIGQAPVVATDVFDMVSNGTTFDIFLPSKNEFITGPTQFQHTAAKPIENLRPQHLTGAIFWRSIPPQDPVLFEEASDAPSRYYILTVVQPPSESAVASTGSASSVHWKIAEKVWFDRADLKVARIQKYDREGRITSDVRYSDWNMFGTMAYPRRIDIRRPASDYELKIQIVRLTLNEAISPDRFVLKQPPGTKLVQVGEQAQPRQPPEARIPETHP